MKQLYILLLCFSSLSWGQVTIFSENIGTASGTLAIEANTFENSGDPNITFSGNADTRSTGSSAGTYTDASGGRNVFFGTGSGINARDFVISGINTQSFTNVTLSFGMNSNANVSLLVEYSTDGSTFTPITFDDVEASGWKLITIPSGVIPSVPNLTLRFSKDDGTTYRVDDVVLSGVPTVPILSASTSAVSGFSYVVGAGPSSSQSFNVLGANLNGSDVTLSLPGASTFEIASSEAGTYSSSVTLTGFNGSETAIFVRLKEALTVGDYSDVITISGGGADDITLDVSGNVIEDIFLIYEFTGDQLTATQFPQNTTVSEFQVTNTTPTFGTAQASTWTGSGVPYAQSGQGWEVDNSENAKYFFFTLEADSGFEIDITNISFEWRATANGPSAITVEINGTEISTFNAPGDLTSLFSAPVSFENETQIEVRIKGWLNGSRDNTNGTGILRIDDVRLDGSVEAGLSIDDVSDNKGIKLYPNPANQGNVTIQTDLAGTKQIEVYDVNGRQVLTTTTTGNSFNVDNFNAGLYLVRISVGEVSKVSKLIIN
jgi:hypothetical protein